MGQRLAKAVAIGACASALAGAFAGAPGSTATAADIPTFASSSLTCEPYLPTGSQRGSDILCKLKVVAGGAWATGVTADIQMPTLTTFDPSLEQNREVIADNPANPTVLHVEPNTLGLMSPGMVKTVGVVLRVKTDAPIGEQILSTATIHSIEAPDQLVPMTTPLRVMHDPVDLTPSTMVCKDAGPLPLRAGDDIACTIQLIDKELHQDAIEVGTSAILPNPLTWLTGGNETSHAGGLIQWNTAFLPDGVKAGPPTATPLTFFGHIPKSLGGNKRIKTLAEVSYIGAESRQPGSLDLEYSSLITAPEPADLTASTLNCVDDNGGDLVRNDPVTCTLTVIDAPFHEDAADVSATAPVPVGGSSTEGDPVPIGTDKLGSILQGTSKSTTYALKIAKNAVPGSKLSPTADVHGRSVGTESAIEQHVIAPELPIVARPPADLTPSTLTCRDAGPEPLRPGDDIDCTIQLVDRDGLEDAIAVVTRASIPGPADWLEGGNGTAHDGRQVSWDESFLAPDGVVSGPPTAKPLQFRAHVPDDTPGGVSLVTTAQVDYFGAETGKAGTVQLSSPALVTAPQPADLVTSKLGCNDTNGAPLYAGETLDCSMNIVNGPGREDFADGVAKAPWPEWARTEGTDPLTFGTNQLGTVRSGSSRVLNYQLRVYLSAPAGTLVTPTADVTGRSVGSEKAISQHLVAPTFIVAARPAIPVDPVVSILAPPLPVAEVAAVAAAAPAKAPAKVSRICGSRRVVNVRIRPPRGKHWKSVSLSFAKKKVKAKKAKGSLGKRGYFAARLVFQGLPKGPLKVTVSGLTTKQKKVVSFRNYKLCTKKGS